MIVSLPFLVWWVFATFDLGADTIENLENQSLGKKAPAAQAVATPTTTINYVGSNIDFIERDLQFIDAIRYGRELIIVLIMIDPVTKTRLRLDAQDLRYESGLQYSLVGNNKLLLKQGNKKRVLYRTPEPDTFQAEENPSIQDTLNDSAAKSSGALNIPF